VSTILTITQDGFDWMLGSILGNVGFSDLVAHLYVNSGVTWFPFTTLADLVECTTPNYAPLLVGNTMWDTPGGSGFSQTTGPVVTFQFHNPPGPTETIFGRYYTIAGGSVLVFGQDFDAPIPTPIGNSTLDLFLSVSMFQGP
jgi:hypothetical protein